MLCRCIDGFSRKIMWLRASHTNHHPGLIATYYTQTVASAGGYPACVRSDCGTENVTIAAIQSLVTGSTSGHRYGTSPGNQRIEAWWSFFSTSSQPVVDRTVRKSNWLWSFASRLCHGSGMSALLLHGRASAGLGRSSLSVEHPPNSSKCWFTVSARHSWWTVLSSNITVGGLHAAKHWSVTTWDYRPTYRTSFLWQPWLWKLLQLFVYVSWMACAAPCWFCHRIVL